MPLSVSATATPSTGAAPFNTVLHATAAGGTAPYAFYWTDTTQNMYIGGGNDPVYSVYNAGTLTVECRVIDATGATATTTVAVTSTAVTVPVTTDPTPASGTLDGEGKLRVVFTASPTGGASPYAVIWKNGTDVLGVGTSLDYSFDDAGDHVVTCEVQDANGVACSTDTAVRVFVQQISNTGFPFRDEAKYAKLTLSVSGRSIDYWLQYKGWTERRNANAGGVSKCRIAVDWRNKTAFRQYALGFTRRDTSGSSPTLKRHLPLQNLDDPTQYLMDLQAVEYGSPTGNTTWIENKWVIYDATFGVPDYFLVSDDQLASAGITATAELTRYVTRTIALAARERKVSNFAGAISIYQTPEVKLPVQPFVMMPESTCRYKWWHVPARAFPLQTVVNMLGKINDRTWDYTGANSKSGVGGPWGKGTLLFVGVAEESMTPYLGPDDQYYVSPVYTFRHNPKGWNFTPVGSSDQWVEYGYSTETTGAGNPRRSLYQYADFTLLFRPQ